MFSRNLKSSVAVALSALTLSTCATPARAAAKISKTEKTVNTLILLGVPAVVIATSLTISYRCFGEEFKQIPVKKLNLEDMSHDEIKKYLDEQIAKFESLGGRKLFVIDENLKKEANITMLALILKGFNEIFAQYPKLIKSVIPKLKLGFIDEEDVNYQQGLRWQPYNTNVWTDPWGEGIFFKKSWICGDYADAVSAQARQVKAGERSDLDLGMLIEAVVAREIGIYISRSIKNDYDPRGSVVKLAKSRNPKLADIRISKMGEHGNVFWFAEVFAHSMYGKEQNDLSRAMQEYLYKNL